MAAITTEGRDLAAIRLGFELFVKPSRTARFGTASLRNIIANIDNVMNADGSALPGAQTVEATLLSQARLIEGDLSIAEVSKAIEAWVIEKHGPASV